MHLQTLHKILANAAKKYVLKICHNQVGMLGWLTLLKNQCNSPYQHTDKYIKYLLVSIEAENRFVKIEHLLLIKKNFSAN